MYYYQKRIKCLKFSETKFITKNAIMTHADNDLDHDDAEAENINKVI